MSQREQLWRFFRAGGFDQVKIETATDLVSLSVLDQKLWVALSCPVKGLQFDERTLSLIDTDQDGHVRAPELLGGIEWAQQRLLDVDILAKPDHGVGLAHLRDDEAGKKLAEQAKQLLTDLGKAETDSLTVADVAQAQALFFSRAQAAWEQAQPEQLPLGDATGAADDLLRKIAAKVDDFFLRCRIQAFDGVTEETVVAADQRLAAVGGAKVQSGALSDWPLARINSSGLPLVQGINPAWQADIQALRESVVGPLLGKREVLSESEWRQLLSAFDGYRAWQATRPAEGVENDSVRDLEKLVRLVRDLMTLANNFVSFKAFYTRSGKAIFQAGTLYLDGRSCELCVTVNDPGRHALLASQAGICLVYCDCVRGAQKLSVAAAFTAGDSDQLRVGRNGVFYDAKGQDWDATITRIVEHPISLRQAFWSPYKKLVRAVSDQFEKFASSRAKAMDDKLTTGASAAVTKTAAGAPVVPTPTAAQQAFDVGKFAGIFAAIGMAVGAIGTAVASVMVGILSLKFWQIPFALAGILLMISGPSLLLAWFKLRSRTLGPLLDANGWAINARAKINIPFGTSLTQLARLPDNAECSLQDPYAEQSRSSWTYALWLALLLMVVAMAWAVKGGSLPH